MPQIKQNFSGAKMNKDLDERIVPKGQYRDALNIKISTTDSDSSGVGSVGTVQNLEGNKQITTTSATTGYDGKKSKIIGSVADEGSDKVYFFTAAPVPVDGIASISPTDIISEKTWIDSIVEIKVVGDGEIIKPVIVDMFAVTGTKANTFTVNPANGEIIPATTYLSNTSAQSTPGNGYDQLVVTDGKKYREGMNLYALNSSNVNLLSDGDNEFVKIVDISGNTLTLSTEQTADLDTAVAFKFIYPERVLEFDYYKGDVFNSSNLIPTASIDVLDNLLMWTDGKHEPKKINIDKCKAGTEDLTTHTKLWVNEPGSDTPIIISQLEQLTFREITDDILREHITVIKKAPTSPPSIIIKSSDRKINQDLPIQFNFIENSILPSVGSIKYITFPDTIDFRVDDVYSFEASNVVDPITIRVKILEIDDDDSNLATAELLFIDSDLTAQSVINNWVVSLETKRPFFETKFGRFAYRYQYEDNEYSTFSPWSELAFLPGTFLYTPSKGFNEGMTNTARKISVKDWLPTNYSRPLNVKTIDILWKTTDSANVYIVKSIKREIDAEWKDMSDNTDLSNTGEFIITSEMIHKVVESNQVLRAWDNVPRYARAQTVVSNRIIYGNYTQGYDLDANIGLLQTVVSKKGLFPNAQKSVKSFRNYQFGVVLGDKYGRETPVMSNGYKSENGDVLDSSVKVEKSLSSYSNKFKIKQSWTDADPTHYPWLIDGYIKYYVKETSNEYYNLILDRVYDAKDDNVWLSFNSADRNKVDEETYIILKNEHGSQTPVDEEARYKIIAISNDAPDYIKTVNKDFPKEEMHPKHVYGGGGSGFEGSLTPADKHPDNIISNGDPESQSGIDRILLAAAEPNDGGDSTYLDSLEFKGIPKLRIVGTFKDTDGTVYEAFSPFRRVTRVIKGGANGGEFGFGIEEPFQLSDVFMYQKLQLQLPDASTIDAAGAGTANDPVKYHIQLRDAVVENKPQFDGKFFVKIAKDNTLEARVLNNSLGEYEVLNTYELAFLADEATNPALDDNEYATASGMDYEASSWETIGEFSSSNIAGTTDDLPNFINLNSSSSATDVFWVSWYNSANRTADIFIDSVPAFSGFNLQTNNGVDALTDFNSGYSPINTVDGTTNWHPQGLSNGNFSNGTLGQFTFSVIGPDGFTGTNSYFKSKMQTVGTLFRFRDDPNQEVYYVETAQDQPVGDSGEVISGPINIESKNFDNDGSSSYVDRSSIIVRFKRVGNNGLPIEPNAGLDPTVWDPRGTVKHNGLASMTIEFLQRVASLSDQKGSITTSAACFETEPKEDVGLDIYYEASGAVPVRLKQSNIISFVGSNKIKERASKFSIDNRKLTNNESVEVNLTNNPYAWQTVGDNHVHIKDDDGYLTTTSGVGVAIGDIVKFEHQSGLVTKSKVLDHSKLLLSSVAAPSNRYTITSSALVLGDQDTQIIISSSATGASSVAVGMQVTGEIADNGTFITSIDDGQSGVRIIYVNQALLSGASSVNLTYIDVTGLFKIEKEVWKYSVELPWFNCYSFGNGVESDRIRDDFNAPQIDNGVKASSTFLNYGEENKTSSMIFSGLYNSTSGVNNLNEFNMAEKITKDLNTTYGSIQALRARDNDVVVFTEDKVLKVQSGGKDALFNADGNSQLTASSRVLGTAIPFAGDYGISKNPESLATDSYRMYFADKQRGAVLRLSGNGVTPISDVGMKNYFRENLKYYPNITGSFNGIDDEYNITLHSTSKFNQTSTETISFNESAKGWISFKSFTPLTAVSLSDRYYSVNYNTVWRHHHSFPSRNNFYGSQYISTIEFLFNDMPSSIKSFKNINYEGSQANVSAFTTQSVEDAAGNTFTVNDNEYYNLEAKQGWNVSDITTDTQSGSVPGFIEKEGKWFNYISGDTTTESNLDTSEFSVQGIGFPLVDPSDTQTEGDIIIQAVDANGENL